MCTNQAFTNTSMVASSLHVLLPTTPSPVHKSMQRTLWDPVSLILQVDACGDPEMVKRVAEERTGTVAISALEDDGVGALQAAVEAALQVPGSVHHALYDTTCRFIKSDIVCCDQAVGEIVMMQGALQLSIICSTSICPYKLLSSRYTGVGGVP